jgi:membrane protease YdiL (CAAX protease family)
VYNLDGTVPEASIDSRAAEGRTRRHIELVVLLGVGPALLALGPRWLVSLAILGGGVAGAVALLLDRTFPRRQLWNAAAARPELARVLARTALVCLGILAVTALATPERLLAFPRQRPAVWAIVMVLYPISAFAQEIVYRPFFFHRYGALFRSPRARVLASAALFGWGHVSVNNVLAVVLTAAVGVLFASTYERTRSTLLVSLEHALYGDFVFTVGLGPLFYNATARWFGH